MSNKSNYVCPECGSPIKAWADLDALERQSMIDELSAKR